MGELVPYAAGRAAVWHGDCLAILAALPDASVDSIVTDPPYGLGFMGKQWDDLPPGLPWAQECLRVLKPGGHLVAFGGTRTFHRLAVAVEDAGFEIRDSIAWLYGSGFPKSLDVSKAIDKAAGAERQVLSEGKAVKRIIPGADQNKTGSWIKDNGREYVPTVTAAATEAAEQWQGWGTALKPAFEPIVVGRKPLDKAVGGTVATNVLAHGTGALNIDAARIPTTDSLNGGRVSTKSDGWDRPWKHDPAAIAAAHERGAAAVERAEALGRWPANVVLDESQAEVLDEQSGTLKSGANPTRRGSDKLRDAYGDFKGQEDCVPARGVDIGGASRFFYCAKAPAKERPSYLRFDCYCEGPAVLTVPGVRQEGETCPECGAGTRKVAHPTVKPLTFMRWLARLITPPGGLVVDTFAGTGTTGEACLLEGFRVLLVEQDGEHIPLIASRLSKHDETPEEASA